MTVWYDANNPSDFVTDDSSNVGRGVTLLTAVAVVASGFLIFGAIIRARRLYTLRRALQSGPWTSRQTRVTSLPDRWTRGRSVVEILDEQPLTLVTQASTLGTGSLPNASTLLVAGEFHGWYAVAANESEPIVRARVPRSSGMRKRIAPIPAPSM